MGGTGHVSCVHVICRKADQTQEPRSQRELQPPTLGFLRRIPLKSRDTTFVSSQKADASEEEDDSSGIWLMVT